VHGGMPSLPGMGQVLVGRGPSTIWYVAILARTSFLYSPLRTLLPAVVTSRPRVRSWPILIALS
jgi:hypothetical protein